MIQEPKQVIEDQIFQRIIEQNPRFKVRTLIDKIDILDF
jgi:hypothetical protein